ncbi:GNAT family N-acetyltransferase [Micromonosporaceae bacterium DT55]|uniref:GNAT family N-acetyltransferase n=1 Tax=Melissospora conviva TaxID=3388432 RepID=UPI003C277C22
MAITVTPFTAADTAAVDAAYEVRHTTLATDEPDRPPPSRRRFVARVRHPMPGEEVRWALATCDGEAAGLLELTLPDEENSENSHVTIEVHPAYRRRGVGRALLAEARRTVSALGRKRMLTETGWALPDSQPHDGAGAAFARAAGWRHVQTDVIRRLDVTGLDQARLDELLADAHRRADGYRVVRWYGTTPEEYVSDVAYLEGRLLIDAPLGEMQWQPVKFDAERIRAVERALAERGGRRYSVGVLHEASGRLVAWTLLEVYETEPWHAYQQITLVDPAHRGRRLGILVKIENLRYALDAEPKLRVIDTFNAEANSHMIAINEAMGFVATGAEASWEEEL